MTTEQNKATFRRFVEEVFNKGNVDMVDELVAPDFVENEELPPGFPPGREGVKQLTRMMRSAFPDYKATIEDMVAEGDKVTVRMTWSGTHKSEFMGIPATGKRVTFGVFDIVRFSNDKFAEHWGLMDDTSLMRQLGAVPAPAMAAN